MIPTSLTQDTIQTRFPDAANLCGGLGVLSLHSSEPTVTQLSRPVRSDWRSTAAAVVLVVSFFFVVGLAGWAWFNCIDAMYHCPANGCGDLSQPGCDPVVPLLPYLLGGGILVGALAFWALVRPRGPTYSGPGAGYP